MATLKERANWAITYVVKKHDLSNKKIAQELGFGEETVGAYRNMATDPKLKFIIPFCDVYNIDFLWFSRGDGEPFPGARQQFPEVCGPDTLLYKEKKREGGGEVKESGAPYNRAYDQAGYLLANILSSGDQIMIQAILANLKAFNQAIQSQQKDQDRIAELETRVSALEEKLSGQDEKLKKGEAA